MVKLNSDSEKVKEIRDAIKQNNGYCPCSIIKSDETKCMCKEFRDEIADPTFDGYCHCGLYYKEKDK